MVVRPITVRRGRHVLFQGDLPGLDAWFEKRRPITFLSVCSGIEAASVAWKPLGWRAVGFAEIEKFPSAVLAHHYPNVPNYGDFTKIDAAKIGRVDILCGGTPCQAFSVAGARRSLEDERGNLTLAFVKLAHELNPKNVVWENVPGVLSTKDNAFGCFLAGLVGADGALPPPNGKRWPNAGMVDGPKGRAAWRVLDAQYFGLAQRRKRVILVADFGNGADPAAVLFEPESVRRDSPPSRETGKGIAPTISARTKGGGGLGTDFDLDGGLVTAVSSGRGWWDQSEVGATVRAQDSVTKADTLVAYAPPVARCDTTREGSSQDYESTTMVAVSVTGQISHALKAEGADASEDGTGRGTPIICFSAKDYGADASNDLAPTLRAGGHTGSHANAGVMPAIAIGWNGDITPKTGDNISPTMRAEQGGEGLDVSYGSAVRRLTTRECQRLQGFQFRCSPFYPGAWQDEAGRYWSPDYTAIPWRGKPASECPDGPQYKALGNSWAVPKFRWLGERIERYMPQ